MKYLLAIGLLVTSAGCQGGHDQVKEARQIVREIAAAQIRFKAETGKYGSLKELGPPPSGKGYLGADLANGIRQGGYNRFRMNLTVNGYEIRIRPKQWILDGASCAYADQSTEYVATDNSLPWMNKLCPQ